MGAGTISAGAVKRRARTVLKDYGVRGYTARVGAVQPGVWAHCDFTKREVVLSWTLLDCDWVFINQIILHEVAHAVAGAGAKHGKEWLRAARAMGYRMGARVPYVPVPRGHKWVAVCETRAHSAMRYERGADDGVLGCKPCLESGAGDVGVLWEML